ncbi:hypothetical protein JL720_1970 [Aureococcus anophagefferens]|nr:hypothetical protein JL720_1970 [Aureococcus anophagefferens]
MRPTPQRRRRRRPAAALRRRIGLRRRPGVRPARGPARRRRRRGAAPRAALRRRAPAAARLRRRPAAGDLAYYAVLLRQAALVAVDAASLPAFALARLSPRWARLRDGALSPYDPASAAVDAWAWRQAALAALDAAALPCYVVAVVLGFRGGVARDAMRGAAHEDGGPCAAHAVVLRECLLAVHDVALLAPACAVVAATPYRLPFLVEAWRRSRACRTFEAAADDDAPPDARQWVAETFGDMEAYLASQLDDGDDVDQSLYHVRVDLGDDDARAPPPPPPPPFAPGSPRRAARPRGAALRGRGRRRERAGPAGRDAPRLRGRRAAPVPPRARRGGLRRAEALPLALDDVASADLAAAATAAGGAFTVEIEGAWSADAVARACAAVGADEAVVAQVEAVDDAGPVVAARRAAPGDAAAAARDGRDVDVAHAGDARALDRARGGGAPRDAFPATVSAACRDVFADLCADLGHALLAVVPLLHPFRGPRLARALLAPPSAWPAVAAGRAPRRRGFGRIGPNLARRAALNAIAKDHFANGGGDALDLSPRRRDGAPGGEAHRRELRALEAAFQRSWARLAARRDAGDFGDGCLHRVADLVGDYCAMQDASLYYACLRAQAHSLLFDARPQAEPAATPVDEFHSLVVEAIDEAAASLRHRVDAQRGALEAERDALAAAGGRARDVALGALLAAVAALGALGPARPAAGRAAAAAACAALAALEAAAPGGAAPLRWRIAPTPGAVARAAAALGAAVTPPKVLRLKKVLRALPIPLDLCAHVLPFLVSLGSVRERLRPALIATTTVPRSRARAARGQRRARDSAARAAAVGGRALSGAVARSTRRGLFTGRAIKEALATPSCPARLLDLAGVDDDTAYGLAGGLATYAGSVLPEAAAAAREVQRSHAIHPFVTSDLAKGNYAARAPGSRAPRRARAPPPAQFWPNGDRASDSFNQPPRPREPSVAARCRLARGRAGGTT